MAGRFLSVDPSSRSIRLGLPQSWNRYAYVMGNPLKYVDPFGELWFKVGGKWQWFEGVDYMEEVNVKADGISSSKQVKGLARLVAFDGATLTLYDKDGSQREFNAVSGQVDAAGRTQPSLQGKENVGPIPAGQYFFNPATIQNFDDLPIHQQLASLVPPQVRKVGEWPGGVIAWGKQRVELTPDRSTNTHGRGGFFIHGGAYPGSAGCIDLCGAAADFFSAVPDTGGEIPVFVSYP
jgi:hypothetical protein